MKSLIVFFAMLSFLSCVKNPNHAAIDDLKGKIYALEKEFAENEEKLKEVGGEEGAQNQLAQENALLGSRIERLKVNLKSLKRQR